jgi:PAS domain S-box-containing protein
MNLPDASNERLFGELRALREHVAAMEAAADLRRRAAETLLASEKRFRALIEHCADAIALLDLQGIVRYASPSTLAVLGYAADEFVGRNVFELMHPEDLGHLQGLFGQLLQQPGATLRDQFRFRHQDGSWRWIEGSGTNLLAEPSIQAIVTNYRDVTERRQALEEIRRLNRELERRVAELEDALAQVKQLRGLLPMCSWCQKVRDDQDYWHRVEDYFSEHTELRFTHGICPECHRKLLESEDDPGTPPSS